MRLRPIVVAFVLAGMALLLAGTQLDRAPLDPQELAFNAQARSVLGGRTPVFFHVVDETWLQPLAVYANAAITAVSGSEFSGRIASALLAAADVALVVLITHAIAGSALASAAAGVTLLFTPAHQALAVTGTDAIFPAALVLLWLYGIVRFLNRDSIRALAGAAVALGVCTYAHPAGPVTAIFLWALTLFVARRRNRWRLFAATAVMIALWLPAVAWFYFYRDSYPDTFGRWVILAAHIRNPGDAWLALTNANTLGTRASLYWGFWDPSWLFFGTSTAASPMLLFEAVLIAAALLRLRHLAAQPTVLIVGGALIVPVVGATFGVPHYITAAAPVLPLLAIIAGLGFDQLVAVLTRRQPLENEVAMAPVDGWDADKVPPRA
jgi:4-amino-4-deoxy-L-arabinose transferase-like glycosyltransferase